MRVAALVVASSLFAFGCGGNTSNQNAGGIWGGGKATIRFEFVYDGGGAGKGGVGTLFVNGKKVASGRIEQTQCCMFSADEGADVGTDEGTAVSAGYPVPFKFNGKIKKVTIELQPTTPAAAIEAHDARRRAAFKLGLSN